MRPALIVAGILAALILVAACDTPPRLSRPAADGASTLPPAGWLDYCLRNREALGCPPN